MADEPKAIATEPQRVVRTYASDVAALSSAGQASDQTMTKPVPVMQPAAEMDASYAPAPRAVAEPRQLQPEAPTAEAPQETGSVNALESAGARESILARLKARATPQMERPTPIPSNVSRFPVIPEQFDQVADAPALLVEPKLQQEALAPQRPVPPRWGTFDRPNPIPSFTDRPERAAAPSVSPLHTYTGDFADRIEERGASAFSVLAAEKDAGPARAAAPVRRITARVALAVIGGVILVLAGGTGIYYAYVSHQAKQPVMVTPGIPSLIFVDDRVAVHGSGTVLRQAILDAETKPLDAGQVRLTYLAIATTTATGATADIPQPGGALITALLLPAPDILLRHVADDSTTGIAHAGTETAPFFILSVDSYDRSFAGMLQWEPQMPRDLAEFYPAYQGAALPIATTTGTTTQGASVAPASVPYAAQFSDEIVANHDVRALKDTNGHTVLLYGYQDQQTLIIARDEAAFTELLNRLAASSR